MKDLKLLVVGFLVVLSSCQRKSKEDTAEMKSDSAMQKAYFIDVHNLKPGEVTAKAVADAHLKDLAAQGEYGVNLLKYWVDEAQGKVYCLAQAPDSASISNTHKTAHGLIPERIYKVSDGPEAEIHNAANLFFDVHKFGPGKVNAKAVAEAHEKDLATQEKYNANFINYWVDEKLGVVMCLAEAPDSAAMISTHREAHGLLPNEVHKVMQGN